MLSAQAEEDVEKSADGGRRMDDGHNSAPALMFILPAFVQVT